MHFSDLKVVCLKETNAVRLVLNTLDECARRCEGTTDLFAYGTNEFGGQGCQSSLCKCYCVRKKADTSDHCHELDKHSYWFFQYKQVINSQGNGRLILNHYPRNITKQGKKINNHYKKQNKKLNLMKVKV